MAKRRRAYTKKDISNWSKKLSRQVDEITEETKDNLEKGIEVIMNRSQELVPEDTGRTKDSAYTIIQEEKGRLVARFGYDLDSQVPYITYIYYEPKMWKKNGASHLWLDFAFQEKKEEAYNIISGKRNG